MSSCRRPNYKMIYLKSPKSSEFAICFTNYVAFIIFNNYSKTVP